MKHVLITGSTRGIGFGLAKNFLRLGCKVTINGTTHHSVEEAIDKLKDIYSASTIQGFTANVSDYREVADLWDQAVARFGPIDIFINNAGITNPNKNTWEITPEDTEKIIDINLLGVIIGSKVAFEGMLKQGYGQIFNMEGFGSDGSMGHKLTLYGTTKRAINYFTSSLAMEAERTPIKVGSLRPGMVVTDLLVSPLAEMEVEERKKTEKIFNILADQVDTVTEFLAEKILANKKNNVGIRWLTKGKVIWRFFSSVFKRRKVI